ncbi:RsfA family transcriptional regulator [Alkalihalobacillus sp. AL-G]|uniref:RsfA family transcriptional regulator n=1 Tax=Alkalihalobacillus sp. AL-G TaxID=2926399 RepID=UPI00272D93BD|nr:RsfA family transcriptional regulator [Alkalihalobacillus sp. AL-G]WLD92202.1 RsfA family transcriptional regulator [Alkalihalobacillus sp. AL-G]
MTNIRQDAWSEEDDLLLAETVLRHVREGSTQLLAFEEVGDKLDRTSAAVGFRWNAIVRKKYEQALKIARRQRKERKRAVAEQPTQTPAKAKANAYQSRLDDPIDFENYHPLSEPKSRSMVRDEVSEANITRERENAVENKVTEPEMVHKLVNETAPSRSNGRITLDSVIEFLQNLNVEQTTNSSSLQQQNDRLERECKALQRENNKLEASLNELTENFSALKDDYQALLQIMDRARRMVLLQDQEELASPKFKMDKNGNLEKLAK